MNKTRELAEKLAYREQYVQQDVALTIIDAKAEIDALPDPMIGLSEMREYGYQWNEMLPLTQRKHWNYLDMICMYICFILTVRNHWQKAGSV